MSLSPERFAQLVREGEAQVAYLRRVLSAAEFAEVRAGLLFVGQILRQHPQCLEGYVPPAEEAAPIERSA